MRRDVERANWGRANWIALLLLAVLAGGCAGSEPTAELITQSVPQAAKMPATRAVAVVALQPLIGPPPVLASKIVTQLNEAAVRENIALVVDGNVNAPTALKGFMIVQSEAAGVKFTFVWDVVGPGGARIGRITGEQAIPSAAPAGDAWSVIPDSVIQAMAAQVVAGLASSMPASLPSQRADGSVR